MVSQRTPRGLIHHSDRGSQYLSIVYTERLAAEGGVTSVGSRGDSYDNALAESVIGLYKAELIFNRGPWRTVEDVELATLAWVHWWNTTRLHSAVGHVPPAEFERRWLEANRSGALSGSRSDANGAGGRKTPEESSPEQLVLGPLVN